MRVGVPRGRGTDSHVVPVTPPTVGELRELGYGVVVEAGAGDGAGFDDDAYRDAGAAVGSADEVWGSDVLVTLSVPSTDDVARLASGAVLIAPLEPASRPELLAALAARGVVALALDAVPRVTRAQSFDILSTRGGIAGYRAVVEAAEAYGGMFAPQVTAAGSTPPATVFVIGAGVAGLAAIGAAVSLGARVRAFDVRPDVAEQIESMGATFVRAPAAQQEISPDGYARPLTPEQERAAMDLYAQEAEAADIVITTALVRGRAPRTLTAEMVERMRRGSVIVDLAASGGGNCELTVPGERVVTDRGVVVIGDTDLIDRMAGYASGMLATNILHLVRELTPAHDGAPVVDLEDVVVRAMTVTSGGEVIWPPPVVEVSAAPPPAPAPEPEPSAVTTEPDATALRRRRQRRVALYGLLATIVALGLSYSTPELLGHMTVFALAVIVGFYVISNVSHSLHTPLMSQTNAISGIILVGALLQIGSDDLVLSFVAAVAAAIAAINVVGGFRITYRVLAMFRKEA